MDKRWRIFLEFGPAVAFTLLSQYEVWAGPIPHMGGSIQGPKPVLSAVLLVVSAGLALRLRYPLLAVGLAMGPFGVHEIVNHFFGPGGPNLFEAFLSQVFIVYSTAANTAGRRTYAGAAIIVAYQLLGYGPTLPGSFDQASGEWTFYAIAWVLGKTVRHRQLRGDRLEARTAELEEQRESQIQSAIADERARIARELHDIVAHSVSLMVLQAGAARQALERQPEKARAPLLSVEATGRTAMSELRRLVGMLRQPGDEDQLAPQPSLRHVDLLVNQMREAGLMVELDSRGSLESIPPGVDLSAYRIAQEALTNALKHSGATHVDLKVRSEGGAVEVAVEDNGRGPSGNGAVAGGHGLIGMRERVNLFGGRFEAGGREGGGFRVFAHLPYDAE
ncbi:MAG TPA: sensor histidine kinase [Candidatus Dormibacteraeota bacterium]|nr:sensor histidine kinase [Candidatus Dormibacteraeota bacterium]